MSNKINMKKSETNIVEFKALALVQGPVGIRGQVNSQRSNIRPDIMRLPLTLCCNLSFVISLRTRIPERKGLIQNETSRTKYHTLVGSKLNGFPLAVPKE